MIAFIDDPRWDTSPSKIRQMQEKQELENKLADARRYAAALKKGNVVFPKNREECSKYDASNVWKNCENCVERCWHE